MDHKPIVLIADDEQTNIEIVSKVLADKYDLRVANNGGKALKAIEKFDVDLLLLDVHMPELDGFELTQKLRSQREYDSLPIIFLTSQDDENSIVKGFEIGGNDYITKPFNIQELLARVKTHLHVHQLQKFLEMMLNIQSTIIVLSDGTDLKFINKTGLDFFGLKNNNEFFKHHNCICDAFLDVEGCYYSHNDDVKWIEELKKLPVHQRHVAISSKDGSYRIFQVSVQSAPKLSMFIIDFNDITESVQKQKQLENEVIHDSLTGAYNRTYFNQHIAAFTNLNRYDDKIKAILFLDIDHFKNVNDTFGHDVGDNVLREFVDVLQQSSRQSDTLIRWGGEEFICIMTLHKEASLEKIVEKLRKAVEIHSFATVKHLTCSIGVSILQKGEHINQTIKRADEALYQSKSDGRNRASYL